MSFSIKHILFLLLPCLLGGSLLGQIKINEGSNQNNQILSDEDGEHKDWIELYNSGTSAVDLFGYSLTDNADEPQKWTFPHYMLQPGAFVLVYCSGKDRFASQPFTSVLNETEYLPYNGWNRHSFTNSFVWDGVSDIALNVCSYVNTQYTLNCTVRLMTGAQPLTCFNYNDGNDASCSSSTGYNSTLRPLIRFNGLQIGNGNAQNSPYDYPAPYGNWYWSARNQFIYTAEELNAAGLEAGPIDSLSFEVLDAIQTTYTYIDFSLNNLVGHAYEGVFLNSGGSRFHTNFKIDASGEQVYLFGPNSVLADQLDVDAEALNLSVGRVPNGSANVGLLQNPSPGESNNGSVLYSDFALPPVFSINSGVYSSVLNLDFLNANGSNSTLRYTLDGSNPGPNSPIYNGTPVFIFQNSVVKARCFKPGLLPSEIKSATYLIGVSHTTPIVSVTTQADNLYGPEGIFDNYNTDWEKQAHVQYFDEIPGHPLLFSQATSMRIDGGAGGSRSHPQHSFRLDLDHSLLGDGAVNHTLIPDRPNRSVFGSIYLRNGSNQWNILPHKDAAQVRMLGKSPTHNHYMAYRPVSVYVNGQYFGLYELREKFNKEYFQQYGWANDSLDLLSLSYYYGSVLRAVEGSIEPFWEAKEEFNELETDAPDFMEQASSYFDLNNYTDYIFSQLWVANFDWPQNNIKLFRSPLTNNAWRFCIQDFELGLRPNSWSDCQSNSIERLINDSESNPFSNMWLRSMQNRRYFDYFINRSCDLMNSTYLPDSLLEEAQDCFVGSIAEMPKQFARWVDPNNVSGLMNEYAARQQEFEDDLVCRSDEMRTDLRQQYGLGQFRSVLLNVEPPGAGTITISTITPQTYPWEGVYFDGIPVRFEAQANPGFTFVNWDAHPLITNTVSPSFTDTLDLSSLNFTANFIADASGVHAAQNENLWVFPNPTNGLLHIAFSTALPTNSTINVFSADGRFVQQQQVLSGGYQFTTDCSSLPAGVYYLAFSNDALNSRLRFVKQ